MKTETMQVMSSMVALLELLTAEVQAMYTKLEPSSSDQESAEVRARMDRLRKALGEVRQQLK
jgi:hypothetical protein